MGAPEALGAILDRAGDNRFSHARVPVAPDVWRAAVGARIAERAQPVRLDGGVLLLRVPTSVWAHELSLLAEEVCARLRERGVEARALRFKVGTLREVDRPAERRARGRAVPSPRDLPPLLSKSLDGVGDPDLRAAIARAAAANLAWQDASQPPAGATVSEARRAARAPRSSEEGTCPPVRADSPSRATAPGTRGAARDRRR